MDDLIGRADAADRLERDALAARHIQRQAPAALGRRGRVEPAQGVG
jgi:hypothetical protein